LQVQPVWQLPFRLPQVPQSLTDVPQLRPPEQSGEQQALFLHC
jgi:hypothetical protein